MSPISGMNSTMNHFFGIFYRSTHWKYEVIKALHTVLGNTSQCFTILQWIALLTCKTQHHQAKSNVEQMCHHQFWHLSTPYNLTITLLSIKTELRSGKLWNTTYTSSTLSHMSRIKHYRNKHFQHNPSWHSWNALVVQGEAGKNK